MNLKVFRNLLMTLAFALSLSPSKALHAEIISNFTTAHQLVRRHLTIQNGVLIELTYPGRLKFLKIASGARICWTKIPDLVIDAEWTKRPNQPAEPVEFYPGVERLESKDQYCKMLKPVLGDYYKYIGMSLKFPNGSPGQPFRSIYYEIPLTANISDVSKMSTVHFMSKDKESPFSILQFWTFDKASILKQPTRLFLCSVTVSNPKDISVMEPGGLTQKITATPLGLGCFELNVPNRFTKSGVYLLRIASWSGYEQVPDFKTEIEFSL